MWSRQTGCPLHCFSLVVCRHPDTKKWLAVEEGKNRGWWLPGGFVEPQDKGHMGAAIRETKEEAGIDVVLKGILRVENDTTRVGGRQRVIFYAEPKDLGQAPKTIPDKESLGAAWLTVEELQEKKCIPPPKGLRGHELLDWAMYIEAGGTIHPLDVFSSENTPVPRSSAGSTAQPYKKRKEERAGL